MKRIIIIFLSITFILLILLLYITNDNYYNNISKSIKDNYANINLYYVNKYNDYYIFLSDENYGVLDGEYNEIMLISKSLVHDNTNNYDVIYKDNKLIYQEEVLDKDKEIQMSKNSLKVSTNNVEEKIYKEIEKLVK